MARNARKKPDQFVVRKRADLAKALGVSVGRVDQFLAGGMGLLKTDGAYSVAACKAWVADHVQKHGGNRGKRQPPADPDEALMDPAITGTSPALERYRNARAGLAELDLQKRQGELIVANDVRVLHSKLVKIIRSCGEDLQRQCGEKAFLILDDKLTEAEEEIEAFCDATDEGGS